MHKGKKQQWDAAERIDWSQDLDPENPMMLDEVNIPIFGSHVWDRMNEKERRELRHHQQASQISQFMHGEQGALMACAKIVQTVPDLDAKFYAATQVMDEARHVEAYRRLLHEKFELAYPITKGLATLLEQAMTDSRWDMTYLAMQVLIEGLALAAFQRIRDGAKNPSPRRSTPMSCRTRRAMSRSAGWRCATTIRNCRTRNAMSARSSSLMRAGTCASGSTSWTSGTGSAFRCRSASICWTSLTR